MPDFKWLMDTTQQGDIGELGRRFAGFDRYARMLEAIAAGIQSGAEVNLSALTLPGDRSRMNQKAHGAGEGRMVGDGAVKALVGRHDVSVLAQGQREIEAIEGRMREFGGEASGADQILFDPDRGDRRMKQFAEPLFGLRCAQFAAHRPPP
jgi:hypothetical protein